MQILTADNATVKTCGMHNIAHVIVVFLQKLPQEKEPIRSWSSYALLHRNRSRYRMYVRNKRPKYHTRIFSKVKASLLTQKKGVCKSVARKSQAEAIFSLIKRNWPRSGWDVKGGQMVMK